jgi:phosphoribosyl-ATP pyrophosphohydrolase
MFDFNSIKILSDTEKGDIFKRIAKVGEEFGEFCAALLEENGFKVAKKKTSKAKQREHVLEEGIDLIQVALDVLIAKGFTESEINDMMEKKVKAWENVLIKKGLIVSDEKIRNFMRNFELPDSETPDLIQNAMKCLECGTIIQSRSRYDYVKCDCPNQAMVDGGLEYNRYGAADMSKIENYSISKDASFDEYKSKLVWGTYGKLGDQPLKYVPLIECETDHLHAILKNVPNINPTHEAVIVSILKDRGEFK